MYCPEYRRSSSAGTGGQRQGDAQAAALAVPTRIIGADPAVFSNPFISTLVDALGLVVYFFIAQAVLGI